MNKTHYILLFVFVLSLSSCEKVFDYSPYVIDFDEDNSDINHKSIQKILNQNETDSVIRIAFTGDSHRAYDELDEFVEAVNNFDKPIDFVVHVGDIADFGLPQQYLWGNEYLLKLNVPYIVVIGNHDLVSNGGDAYQEMFGVFNFSFIYKKTKFVVINTNSLEFDFNGRVPDVNWLDQQLKPDNSFSYAVVFFHVAPMHQEFDPDLIGSFNDVLAKYHNVVFVAHGHMHDYSVSKPYPNGIPYVNVYSVEHKKYNVIELKNDTFEVATYSF
jgi:Icc-related predicted phosphoesterase